MTADRRLTLAVVSAGTAMLLLDVTVVNDDAATATMTQRWSL